MTWSSLTACFERVVARRRPCAYRRSGTLEKPQCGEAQHYSPSEEQRRLPSGEILHFADQFADIALANGVGHALKLRRRLPDVMGGLGNVTLELAGGAARCIGDGPDVIGAHGLLPRR